MESNLNLEFASMTDTGRVRAHNEDSIVLSPDYGVAILADGMGGYNAGEVASTIATAVIREVVEAELHESQPGDQLNRMKSVSHLLDEAVTQANLAILDAALEEPDFSGMGTTLVMALFHHDKVTLAHVGDSRCYRYRSGRLEQLTRDHSQLQEQIDAGLVSPEWAQFAQNKNLITRAVGVDAELQVEVHEYTIQTGDLYLLCSDGLSDMLMAQQLEQVLGDPASDLTLKAETLVTQANECGGRDNISVILVRVRSVSTEKAGLFGRIMNWMK
jgi:protein phosphatase